MRSSCTITTNQSQNDFKQNSQVIPITSTPISIPKFAVQEAFAVVQIYYDCLDLSPRNMHVDIAANNGTIHDGIVYD